MTTPTKPIVKHAVLFIPTGEPLYYWDEMHRKFTIAIFANRALAGHAIHSFCNAYYPSKNNREFPHKGRKKHRCDFYHNGLFTSEFVHAWEVIAKKSPWYRPHYTSWQNVGLTGPTNKQPWSILLCQAIPVREKTND